MTKTKIRILGILMILVGILLLTDTLALGNGFLYGVLIGILIGGGIILVTTGKFKLPK